MNGSSRQPKFILPTAAMRLAAGQSVAGLALVSALWARYCYGEQEDGVAIPANDPHWDRLNRQAQAARSRPEAWLEMRDIFAGLADNVAYAMAFTRTLRMVWDKGVRQTLEQYLQGRLA
jgi:mannitol 2-dehydrogenase